VICPECKHDDKHDRGGIGVCGHPGCGCDGGMTIFPWSGPDIEVTVTKNGKTFTWFVQSLFDVAATAPAELNKELTRESK
jgi:hypothetical protein